MIRSSPLLHSLGAAGLIGAAAAAHSMGLTGSAGYSLFGDPRLFWWSLFALVYVAVSYSLGVPEALSSPSKAASRAMTSSLGALSVISLCQLALATPLLPRLPSASLLVLLPLWSAVAWRVHLRSARIATDRSRALLVGGGAEAATALSGDLAADTDVTSTLVGVLGLDDEPLGADAIAKKAHATKATVVIFGADAADRDDAMAQVANLHLDGMSVRSLVDFYEQEVGKVPHSLAPRSSLLFDISELHGGSTYQRLKRLMDVAVAFVGLVALAPLVLIVALLNPLFNPGPLLYRQRRVGRGGEPFTILKLRTMTPSAMNEGDAERTAANDQRVTRLGGLLRKSHLDELPQVINIWRGDLSIVGPRPEQPGYAAELSSSTPVYRLRHTVRPGLTGWAQVRQGYVSTQADSLTKLQYDLFYLRHQSLGLDCKVLWMTLREVVSGLGR